MSRMTQTATVDRSLDEQIGMRVHQLMWQKRVTQTALAPQIGVAQSVLGRKLRGTVTWTARDVVAAAGALGVTPNDLLVGPVGLEPTTYGLHVAAGQRPVAASPAGELVELDAWRERNAS